MPLALLSSATEPLPCEPQASEYSPPAGRLNDDRALAGWTLLAAILSFAALATPFLLGQVYVADDLGEFHLPIRSFYSDQLARGEAFDWIPSLYGGFYLSGEGQLGGYHPLHWVLYRWLPLGAAFDLELLISYPLLFGGTYLFLRRWKVPLSAALFGALAFTFGSFNLLHFVHPNAVAIVAHLPWLLWLVDIALVDSREWRRALACLASGLLLASQLLLGYPQYVWLSSLLVATYASWRAVSLRVHWKNVAWLALAVLLGTLTAGVQLLPTYDLLGDSVRSAPDVAFANTGSLHPLNLMQLIAPYLIRSRVVGQNTHELGTYLGAAPALLCLWLITKRQRWGRLPPLVWASVAFGILAFLLSIGEAGWLYRLQLWLPVVNRFRFPCRAIVLVQLCTATLAAVSFGLLTQKSRETIRETPRSGAFFAVVAASTLLAIVGPLVWSDFVADAWLVWLGPLLVATAACLISLAERGARWALVAIVLFTAVDLSAYGLSYSVVGRTSDLQEFVARTPRPPKGDAARIAAPDNGSGLRTGDRMLLAGLTRIDGYAGLEPARKLDYRDPRALQLAGVGWIFKSHGEGDDRTYQWTELPAPAARVWLLPRADSSSSEELPNDQGMTSVVKDRPGRIELAYESTQRALVATTESFHRGWTATVDDQPATVVRVNRDFLGCEVPPGKHRVKLVFRPASLRLGRWLTASGLGLMVCAIVARLLFRSAPRVETPPCRVLP